jgi:hypothetical protein
MVPDGQSKQDGKPEKQERAAILVTLMGSHGMGYNVKMEG